MKSNTYPPAVELELSGHRPAILHVRGELDLAALDRFRAVLLQALSVSGAVIVDLRECAFIESIGIGVLLATRRDHLDLNFAATPLAVVATGSVARTLRMVSGRLQGLPVYSDVDAARAFIRSELGEGSMHAAADQ